MVDVRRDRLAHAVLGAAVALLAVGCGTAPMAEPTFSISPDGLLARLIETGDLAGFTETADFDETCAVYLAGSERHQLVVSYRMFEALRGIEIDMRGFPYGATGGEPALSPLAEPFRAAVVSRCTAKPTDLVRTAASIEYVVNHETYDPI